MNKRKATKKLTGLKNLTRLELAFQKDLNDDSFMGFTNHHNLEYVDLSGSQITGKTLKIIVSSKLHTLVLYGCRSLDSEAISHLALCPNLEHLDISGCTISDKSLDVVGGLYKLKRLYLNYNKITSIGIAAVLGLTDLEELHLASCGLKDEDLISLYRLTKLRRVNLEFNRGLTNVCIEHIFKIDNLEVLSIQCTNITDYLRIAEHPKLKALYGDSDNIIYDIREVYEAKNIYLNTRNEMD